MGADSLRLAVACNLGDPFIVELLFVDDEPTLRLALGDALARDGHDVTFANDGLEALTLSRRRLFDVVITDVRMPNMNGIELFRRLLAEAPDTDVFLMTANADVHDAVAALKAGAADYLVKPFETDELLARLRRTAQRRELTNELRATRRHLTERVGAYVLEEKIDSGAMGVVYRASHVMLRRPTAVKILTSTSPLATARFEREVQLTCRLTHPNTIAIYDYGRTPDGAFYYAMELLDGLPLDALVNNAGPLPESRVVHVLRQLCGSLQEAHEAGLVHRDVKPSNIQICTRGGVYDVAKLLDFGLVRTVENMGNELTQHSVILGTPAYLAPEVIMDASATGPSQDLYALGAVAYFMLAGKPAFSGSKPMQVCMQQLNDDPPKFPTKVGKKLDALVRACLEKNPKHRPKSAREIARALPEKDWSEDDARAFWNGNETKSKKAATTRSGTAVIKPRRGRRAAR